VADIRCPLSESGEISRHEPGLVTGEGALTYHEFDQLVTSTALRLTDAGFQAGDRVGVWMPNEWRSVVLVLALIRMGAVACPLSARLPEEAVADCLRTVRAEGIIAGTGQTDVAGLRVCPAEEVAVLAPPGEGAPARWKIPLDQPATLIFTSGSSGRPKAVLHSFANHYYNALGANANVHLGSKDRWLLSLPLHHVSGLGILFRCLISGAAVVVPDAGDVMEEALTRYEVTHVSMVAAQLRTFLDSGRAAGSNVKAVLVGGGPVPAKLLVRAAAAELPVYVTYGLTEMASQVTTTPPHQATRKRGSAGPALRYRAVNVAEDGEILVGGRTRFLGYVNGDVLEQPFDEEGWFATGDLGRVDGEGHLFVTGRKDNQFISGGENIHPEEIEALLRALEGIDDAVVVPVPDEKFGQRPVAFLLAEGPLPDGAELAELLARALPRFKVPKTFLAWPDGLGGGIKIHRPTFEALALRLTA
jgi:O-succinylbenzoic acid--CoA ligase